MFFFNWNFTGNTKFSQCCWRCATFNCGYFKFSTVSGWCCLSCNVRDSYYRRWWLNIRLYWTTTKGTNWIAILISDICIRHCRVNKNLFSACSNRYGRNRSSTTTISRAINCEPTFLLCFFESQSLLRSLRFSFLFNNLNRYWRDLICDDYIFVYSQGDSKCDLSTHQCDNCEGRFVHVVVLITWLLEVMWV